MEGNDSFDEMLLFLRQPNAGTLSLYDHLSDLIEKLIDLPPEERNAKLETVSKELKLSTFVQKQSKETELDETVASNVLDRINLEELIKAKELLKPQRPSRKATSSSQVQFVNILEQAYYFKRFGVGLPEEELNVIFLHMKNTFSKMPMKSVRFFGKIIGLDQNYYVVETEPAEPLPPLEDPIVARSILTPEELKAAASGKPLLSQQANTEAPAPAPEDPDAPIIPPPKLEPAAPTIPIEEPKEGSPNQYVYWVCSSPLEDWVRLPDVTPLMIKQSRIITKTLTGHLDTPISDGYPSFDGTERHLLRALIARISHSASVLPRAMIKRRPPGDAGAEQGGEEEEEAEEEDEGNPMVSGVLKANAVVDVATLVEPKGWVHARPPILVQGRVEKWPPKKKAGEGEGGEEGGEEEEEAEEEGEEMDEEEGAGPEAWKRWKNRPEVWEGTDDRGFGRDIRLKRAIEADKRMNDAATPSFAIRRDDVFDASPVVLVKSLYWPGYYTLAYGGKKAKIASIYIGYGRKFTSLPFTLPPPPVLPEEYPDMVELIDPTADEENKVKSGKEEEAPKHQEEEEEEEEGEEEEDA